MEGLAKAGFESSPIVVGNFAKNDVTKYFDYEIHSELRNADYLDMNGVFIGNQNFSMNDAISELGKVFLRK